MGNFRTHTGEGAWVFDMANDDKPYIVTQGFQFDEGWDPDDTLHKMFDAWYINLRSQHPDSLTLRHTDMHYTDTEGDKVQIRLANEPGQSSSARLPQNCALLVQKFTGLAGRKFRGRMYWPEMLSESNVNNVGVIDSGTVTDLQGRFDDVWDKIAEPTDSTVALLHGDKSEATPVTAFHVQPLIATQRRRLR